MKTDIDTRPPEQAFGPFVKNTYGLYLPVPSLWSDDSMTYTTTCNDPVKPMTTDDLVACVKMVQDLKEQRQRIKLLAALAALLWDSYTYGHRN